MFGPGLPLNRLSLSTMSIPVPARPSIPRRESHVLIDVLSMDELRAPAVAHFLSLDPERATWPQEKIDRLVIRTECKWGRVAVDDEAGDKMAEVFLLNEKGGGPKGPLTETNTALIRLYAEMRDGPNGEKGFFAAQPFTEVPINGDTARQLESMGILKLEEFIRTQGEAMEETYRQSVEMIRAAKARVLAKAAKVRAAKAGVKAPVTEIPVQQHEQEGEQGPRMRA